MDLAEISKAQLPAQVQCALDTSQAMKHLSVFSPVLAGTYPIGIHLPTSDLDIICEASSLSDFIRSIRDLFSHHSGYSEQLKTVRDQPSAIIRFQHQSIAFEIFAQSQPPLQQYAVRHMLIEYRLLRELDPDFREKIIDLKAKGLKTEPAFAELLGINTDPYDALYDMSWWQTSQLRKWIATLNQTQKPQGRNH